ncbi:protein kinase domain-containing protein [Citrus sinensis]|uniref:receptor-like serine/threonine-protein kinase ALE2 isoform X2 n=1 Tax=Citrus sinensis TaxID=2711 RepID=UPI0021985DEE|nr:receptor-like serine/threonine-protein kinase ALE2 isoform X2 [Citrus sinensis]KAH9762974.1 protein kinase domain-containing protein [Citrus sinensis]
MGLVMPVILQLVKLCVIGFAFTVQGSAGYGIPPSPAIIGGHFLLPRLPVTFTLKPHLLGGHAPSPIELPTHSAPPPVNIPSFSPSTPAVSVPFDMAPPPSLIPTNPVASPPSITAPPPVNMAPPPSLIPTTPVASPPPITAPPLVNVLPAPSLIPTTPLASPLSSKAFPPASPPSNAARPPASHPSNTARPPASHPSRTAPPPASHPSNTALPSKTAPSPASHPSNTALPPASLPSKTAPPPASHLSNTAPPPASHPYKTSPLPASHPSKTAPPPASHPSNTAPPPASHPSKTAPPPASHPSNTAPPPASHPSKTAPPPASHPSNTAPPPASHPSNTAPPPASHPSNTAPPPASHPSNTALPPASHPSNTAPPPASHPSKTAPPPASHPSNTALPPASHPSNPAIPPASHPSNTAIPPASHPSNTAPPHASHPSNTALTPASHPSNIAPPPLFVPVLPSALPGKAPVSQSPISLPDAPAATPRGNFHRHSPAIHPSMPGPLPPVAQKRNASNREAPIAEPIAPGPFPPGNSRQKSPVARPIIPGGTPTASPDPDVPPSTPPLSVDGKRVGKPVAEPSYDIPIPPPVNHSPSKGPVVPPSFIPTSRKRHYGPPPLNSVSPSHSPLPTPVSRVPTSPSPSPTSASGQTELPLLPPKSSPSEPIRAFPPPPPNADCSTTICTEPYTNTPPGSPCGCVWPMQVGLRLSVALYTFFPLVSELAGEIAAGVFMKQSQVRIIGANAAEQPDKTVVLTDLVPLGEKFDNTTAFLTYQRFWHKQVVIKSSYFGDYEVLYVRYPGLPPSPPSASSSIGIIDDGPYSGNNGRATKPEGVDVPKRRQKYGLSGGMIAIVVLSAFVAVVLCSAAAWVLLFKYKSHACQAEEVPQSLQTSHVKPSGAAGLMVGSGLDSASLSFGSSIATYTGSAKTFSASEIEKATGNFDASRILGEGGFGLVYSGVLDDGTKVAVKVLKRVDQQGGREFLAEVEMLSRLHHRNLVKLIGICIEEQARCLVYELIPNGSVESHLHGVDKESAPLGWDARLKIALGAARALAYLHEDSSPRVIHRDFKSSNILLEHDFTPKVSDFGLARSAMDEESRHISTRVMGTFGYVAPEYAMTGHLLVKSDVYSYGVVILELLSGRKPVDMTQPPGQENLVAWARPLLTSREGLERIIDPSLGNDVPFDSVAKVAAIASMCVQPEVQHRPFMGEVVQALKLVCNECDEAKEVGSASSSQDDMSIDLDSKVSTGSGQLPDPLQRHYSVPNYDLGLDTGRRLSLSYLFSSSARSGKEESELFRRYSSSGPLRTGRGRQFWQRIRRLVGGSDSEHGAVFSLWPGSY